MVVFQNTNVPGPPGAPGGRLPPTAGGKAHREGGLGPRTLPGLPRAWTLLADLGVAPEGVDRLASRLHRAAVFVSETCRLTLK